MNQTALHTLGDRNGDGVDVEHNNEAAVAFYKLEAELNVVLARLQVWSWLLERIGMKRDPEVARRWCRVTAKRGEPQAFIPFRFCYVRCLGVI